MESQAGASASGNRMSLGVMEKKWRWNIPAPFFGLSQL